MAQRLFTLIVLALLLGFPPAPASAALFGGNAAPAFVKADEAFAFDFQRHGTDIRLNWRIRPGYYLYRQQIKLEPVDAVLGKVVMPAGGNHHDEFFGDTEIYRNTLQIGIPLQHAAEGATLRVTYQGCADAGFCYPPETRTVPLPIASGDMFASLAPAGTVSPAPATAAASPFSLWWALLIGIGIAFTPCVLPMYPLISGIILGGDRASLSTGRVLLLSLVYVQGMAITYTLLGIAVAAAGLPLQAALQQPAVLIVLSALFIALALSMFGLFTLQLPSSVQTRLTLWSNRQRSGSPWGVFVMGALAALFCSPCTTAPLSAILLYIAQSGNLLMGGATLYLYALGMGIPLILAALFGHRLLPRGGAWMKQVKEGLGFVILALPIFLLERMLGDRWGDRLWSLLAVAFFGWGFLLSLKGAYRGSRIVQIALLAVMLVAARPLQDWAFPAERGAGAEANLAPAPGFNRIGTLDELTREVNNSAGKPVMLDFYADWCVACKEFEKYTFNAAGVRQAMDRMTLLQADVTANNQEHAALLKQLRVLGLPTIIFFDAQGREIPDSRVTGFMDAAEFQRHLQKIIP
ncbi:protein-disulfide reductase DsbD [Sodalis ligni]|jgi:thiol:disulfide interchange protein DsbD|uniref:Thiol:disulfide interchange protein DsbD n=1 Tax=Sodalis ligni TaxID=2697027 RepID=A0A4R1NK31_9GAMM|nr:protein-disulfide reductase DsbD [Sodalis ligni]TCL06301.1 thiol:disulfide interchange protein DsbD [Sodalis ligni]